jgi:putative (di)nucleoside polyphosphate hydrolase
LRFQGDDTDIQIEQPHPEFAKWRWSTPDEVIENIVPFKRDVYETVIQSFRSKL